MTQRSLGIPLALWLVLLLALAAIGYVVLRGCGITAFGYSILNFCHVIEQVEVERPAALDEAERQTQVLRDRLGDLRIEIAYVPHCPIPPPSVSADEPTVESPPEPVPETPVRPAPEPPPPPPADEFDDRVEGAGGDNTDIQVTLIWNTQHDLDLVIVCPNGQEIQAFAPQNCSGRLDVDANGAGINGGLRARPVENVSWPSGAPPGRYRVLVRPFGNHLGDQSLYPDSAPVPFQVRVRNGGEISQHSGVSTVPNDVSVTEFTIR